MTDNLTITTYPGSEREDAHRNDLFLALAETRDGAEISSARRDIAVILEELQDLHRAHCRATAAQYEMPLWQGALGLGGALAVARITELFPSTFVTASAFLIGGAITGGLIVHRVCMHRAEQQEQAYGRGSLIYAYEDLLTYCATAAHYHAQRNLYQDVLYNNEDVYTHTCNNGNSTEKLARLALIDHDTLRAFSREQEAHLAAYDDPARTARTLVKNYKLMIGLTQVQHAIACEEIRDILDGCDIDNETRQTLSGIFEACGTPEAKKQEDLNAMTTEELGRYAQTLSRNYSWLAERIVEEVPELGEYINHIFPQRHAEHIPCKAQTGTYSEDRTLKTRFDFAVQLPRLDPEWLVERVACHENRLNQPLNLPALPAFAA